jgi:hypothetical protein
MSFQCHYIFSSSSTRIPAAGAYLGASQQPEHIPFDFTLFLVQPVSNFLAHR